MVEVEEVREILWKKAKRYGEAHAEAVLEDLEEDLSIIHEKDPLFAKKFVESIPASYLKDLDNVSLLKRLLGASMIVLEAHRGPGKEVTRNLLDLILAANRRCHTSTKYHVVNLITKVGGKVGIYEVARAVEKFGRPSRTNVFQITRALLLHTHPNLRFSEEEAMINHKVAGIAYLEGRPEFKREWLEILRRGGDVQLEKDLMGSFQVGNKIVLATNSIRRILEAFDTHHSCFSPHFDPDNFMEVLRNPFIVPVVVLGKRGKVLARINVYVDRNDRKLLVGSKVYGRLTRSEALEIFNRLKNLGFEVYVPTDFLKRRKVEKTTVSFEIGNRDALLHDDYVKVQKGKVVGEDLVKI